MRGRRGRRRLILRPVPPHKNALSFLPVLIRLDNPVFGFRGALC